jgi:hypothetical protein
MSHVKRQLSYLTVKITSPVISRNFEIEYLLFSGGNRELLWG